ncbi:MAG: STAS domain-containing protein [Planctomycetota bacterium]
MSSPQARDVIRFERDGAVLYGVIETALLMGEDARGVNDVVIDEAQGPSADARLVAIDLSRVTNINSVAIGVLVSIKLSMERIGKRFALVGAAGPIRELLKVTNLTAVFETYSTRESVRVD